MPDIKFQKIKFVSKDRNLFYQTLKKRVDNYFIENNISKNANNTMIVKAVALIAAYILPFATLLIFQPSFGISLLLWVIMGIGVAGIGMSVMHDANHGSFSKNDTVNDYMGYTLNLVGGSIFNWKLQHNILHHTYTNVVDYDEDIADKGVLRFSPHTGVKSLYKLQFLYAFFFYGIMTLYWIVLKDFLQFFRHIRNGVNVSTKAENVKIFFKILTVKVVHFAVIFAVPTLVFGIPLIEVILGWLLMHFVAGIILTVIFQLAHTVEGTSHPLPDASGSIENDWAIHQLNTTVNFSPNNKLLSWYVGGLNYQVEHHLFPKICHVHYAAIAPIVKQTAEEFNIPYLENETFLKALRSHMVALHRFGRMPKLDEAIA
jgi:linoleoyl-CoA desaturase